MPGLMIELGELANRSVLQRAGSDSKCHGMGTTLEVLVILGKRAWIAHVGDSRTYLIRGGSAEQQTSDHTVAARLSQEQRSEMSEMLDQWGSVLVEAIGAKEVVNVDVEELSLQVGDRLLLCSDGLYEYFDRSDELAEVLSFEGCEAGLERLVQLALDRGGKDNITGLLVDVEELGTGPSDAFGEAPTGPILVPRDLPAELKVARTDAAATQDYGIEDAIELFRQMPEDALELVVTVVKNTLESRGISLPTIIEDASHKTTHIEGRIAALRDEIKHLESEREERNAQVDAIEADLEETAMVRERLQSVLDS